MTSAWRADQEYDRDLRLAQEVLADVLVRFEGRLDAPVLVRARDLIGRERDRLVTRWD
jgi:hypothetical protein